MKLTLTQSTITQRVSKRTGKPFNSQTLKATEYGDRFIGGFASKETMYWKAGDVIDVIITESKELDKTGKPYINWELEKKETAEQVRMNQLEFRLAKHETQIKEIQDFIKGKYTIPPEIDTRVGRNSDGSLVPNFDVPNEELDIISDEDAERGFVEY